MTETLKEKTAKGLFWGGLSNGLQQLLGLLFGICLARLLTPGEYGMVGMLAIFSAIANSIQESGFTAALTNKPDASHKDYNAVFWCSFGIGISLYLILFFCAPLIARFFHTPELTPLSRLVFLGFLISSAGTAQNAILFKHMKVKERAKATLTALIISNLAGIGMAYSGLSYWSIATQTLIYIGCYNALVWHYSPWRPTFNLDLSPIRPMLSFSVKLTITNILHYINENQFSVLLGRCYNRQEVGYYTQAYKWTNMGQSLITGIINGVAQPVLVGAGSTATDQQRVFRKILRFTAFISFPCLFGLASIAPEFITVTITGQWIRSAAIMQILCIWGAFIPIRYLYTNLLVSHGKSNIFMWNMIAVNLAQIILLLLFMRTGVLNMTVAYTALNIGWLLIWHYHTHRLIQLHLRHVLKDITPYLLATLLAIGAGYLASVQISSVWLRMIVKIATTAVAYLGLTWIGGSVIFHECVQFLKKKLSR